MIKKYDKKKIFTQHIEFDFKLFCSRVDLAVGHQHQHNGGWLSALGHIYKKYGIKGVYLTYSSYMSMSMVLIY